MLEEQFVDPEQQSTAYTLGMWIFLASELMLFGGLFLAYTEGRLGHPAEFQVGASHMHRLLGGFNTAVLLTSSTTIALAVERAQQARFPAARRLLLATAALGLTFLGIKLWEWGQEWPLFLAASPRHRLFSWFYYVMTGLHALHLSVGVGAVLVATVFVTHRPTESLVLTGLYWHLVDLLWFFLYPALYLIGGPR